MEGEVSSQASQPAQPTSVNSANNIAAPKGGGGFKKILIIIIILLIIGGGLYLAWKYGLIKSDLFSKKKMTGFSGELSVKDPLLDKGKEVKKTVTAGGSILTTRGSDGTLYSLTIPPDAVILPTDVTLTPLKEVPITNYTNAEAGFGVVVGPKRTTMTFIRPVYLTIKPNTPIPADAGNKSAKYGRCVVGSRGFDPEICAGIRHLPFDVGVDPGKIVLAVEDGDEGFIFSPTIPIGEEKTYSTMLWKTGLYMADKVNEEEIKTLVKDAMPNSNEYVNQTEALMHLAALKGSLTEYKDIIEAFKRSKKDYPREVLKSAMLAKAVGLDDISQERLEGLKSVITNNVGRLKSSFLPMPRYIGTILQIQAEVKKHKSSAWHIIPLAQATSQDDPLGLDFSGMDLQSWDDVVLGDDTDTIWSGAEDSMATGAAETEARGGLGASAASCSDKALAIEVLLDIGNYDSEDKAAFAHFIEECAKDCGTFEECERWGDLADRVGANIDETLKQRFAALLARAGDCDFVKKNLSNYGQNYCP